MYYVTGKGLFKSKRNGNSFEDAEFMGYSTSSDLGYFSYFNLESMIVAEWTRSDLSYYNGTESLDIKIVDENGSLIPEKVAEYLVASARSYSEGYISISTDDVDIRFDVFKDIEGYEEIYEATKGLKNATAIKALDTFRLRNMLFDVLDYTHGYYGWKKNYLDNYSAYKHNFLADILYVKDTDILLCNSDEPVNDSTQVKGNEYFSKTRDGHYKSDGNVNDIMNGDYEYGFVSVNESYQKSDGSIDSSKILKDAFAKCYTHGEKRIPP